MGSEGLKLTLLFLANFPSVPAKLTNRISRQTASPSIPPECPMPVLQCRQIANTWRASPRGAAPCPGTRGAGRSGTEPLCRRGKRLGQDGQGAATFYLALALRPEFPLRVPSPRPCGPASRGEARRGLIPGRRAASLASDRDLCRNAFIGLSEPLPGLPEASASAFPVLGIS